MFKQQSMCVHRQYSLPEFRRDAMSDDGSLTILMQKVDIAGGILNLRLFAAKAVALDWALTNSADMGLLVSFRELRRDRRRTQIYKHNQFAPHDLAHSSHDGVPVGLSAEVQVINGKHTSSRTPSRRSIRRTASSALAMIGRQHCRQTFFINCSKNTIAVRSRRPHDNVGLHILHSVQDLQVSGALLGIR